MEFDLEYKLQQFREEQPELFDKNGERYTATPISKSNGEMMLQLINELESALAKAETEIRQLNIGVISKSETEVCEHKNAYPVLLDEYCPDCDTFID